jgi:hypothetical protein
MQVIKNYESVWFQITDFLKKSVPDLGLMSDKSMDTICHLVETSLKCSGSSYAIANLVYFLYNDKYIVSKLKTKCWYFHDGTRWIQSEVGPYYELSTNIVAIYESFKLSLMNIIDNYLYENIDNDEVSIENVKNILLDKINKCDAIIIKLKNVNSKENICKECAYLFYDHKFIKQIDRNPYLICFRNGVLDLRGNQFRKGHSSDLITLMIECDFKFPTKSSEKNKMNELIEQFQLFRKNIVDSRNSRISNMYFPITNE